MNNHRAPHHAAALLRPLTPEDMRPVSPLKAVQVLAGELERAGFKPAADRLMHAMDEYERKWQSAYNRVASGRDFVHY